VQVRWEGSGNEPPGEYSLFCGKGNENHELGIDFFVHKRILPAVKRVELVIGKIKAIPITGL
jgi:hypothetical protein